MKGDGTKPGAVCAAANTPPHRLLQALSGTNMYAVDEVTFRKRLLSPRELQKMRPPPSLYK